MPDKALDPVEWELVRADIAMEKARLKANGDWSKWEEFQTRTNARLERALIGWRTQRERGLPMTEDERFALWWVVRTPELPWLMAPPRRPRRPGWPLRRRPRAGSQTGLTDGDAASRRRKQSPDLAVAGWITTQRPALPRSRVHGTDLGRREGLGAMHDLLGVASVDLGFRQFLPRN